jgi:hypothetical protein
VVTNVRGLNELDERSWASADLLPSDRARALPNEQDRERGQVMSECECQLENDYLTLCEGHKLELENLKNNPPLWAIRARRGKWKSSY